MAVLFAASPLFRFVGERRTALATVTVQITGFKGTRGRGAGHASTRDSASLAQHPQGLQVVKTKITGPNVTVEFKGVKPGTYAVAVVHDANKNNELDMRWLPWPSPRKARAPRTIRTRRRDRLRSSRRSSTSPLRLRA